MFKRDFILGEDKYIDFLVASRQENVDVVIDSACWDLTKVGKGESLHGDCRITGNMISALICPPSSGNYILTITYKIPPETRKMEVELNVS